MSSSLSLVTAYDEVAHRKMVDELMQKALDYFARENQTGELRVDFKKHGPCTPIDPRAYIPNFDMTPRYVCLVYVNISHMEWNVMVHMGYISNNIAVQLCCLKRIQRMYMSAIAKNRPAVDRPEEATAESYLKHHIIEPGDCIPNNMLTMDHVFVYAPIGGMKRGRDNRPVVQLRNELQQCKLRIQEQEKMDCHQKLQSANLKRGLVATCNPNKNKTAKKNASEHRPTFVIEGEWGFETNCQIVVLDEECFDEDD
jgi:hypothetical protein